MSVYLVEDSPIILRLLIELMESIGATVIGHAETAKRAIADIAKLHPDAVTIDIRLKQGSGFDVLEALSINQEDRPPLRVVLSNYKNDAYQSAAQELGADYFLDKATQMPQLLAALAFRSKPGALHHTPGS